MAARFKLGAVSSALAQLLDARTVVGLLLGVAAAAIGIWLQAGVEHRRWLRQQRLEAFAAFVGGLDAIVRPATRWQLSWGKPIATSSCTTGTGITTSRAASLLTFRLAAGWA
jgi:hypothetical protein